MATAKLTYFNIMGLGESVRYMLSYMGRDFEDFRVHDFGDWMRNYKSKMPFGKLPLLEMDGEKYHQTVAMARYFGNQAGLGGANDWEELQIDIVMDTFSDFRIAVWPYFYSRSEEVRSFLRGPLFNQTIPFYLQKFDDLIKNNNGYLANGKLSWADLYFVSTLGYFSFMTEQDICGKYPNINALKDKVHSIPQIKKWLDKRPNTEW